MITVHIDNSAQAASTDRVLDFVEECINEGLELDDIIASMLCTVAVLIEAESTDEQEWQ